MKKINAILTISRRTLKRNPMIPPVSRSIAIIPVGYDTFFCQHKYSDNQYQGYRMLADTFDNL